ncbi:MULTISPECIES: RNA polymerase sigma factor [Sphingobacterium]|uniref:RNA polymerase sigma factor n=1 Tax=Sphingobacterium TaxID=28453 RepID=UPI0014047EA6|nr:MULTISPECIES: RNA polymerase sigma-70 factor [Sphingobacterium]MCW2263106.1 RNA polymerase sigma-70 factor (ECF subfamily) [Sphingobacterium kitahiroshimense]
MENSEELMMFRKLSGGSESAFSAIYAHYSPKIFIFVDRMLTLPDVTDDLVQDIFIDLWQKRDFLKNIENPKAYLYRMASNRVIDYQKKLAKRRPILDFVISQQQTMDSVSEERILYKETLLLLSEALDTLSPQRRIIYELSRNEGLTHDQIAEKLNIAKSTVANQLVSALKQIRQYLEKNAAFFSFAVFYLLTKF